MRPLADLLAEHRSAAFPASIERGRDYGSIEPVLIDADIFGWASGYASDRRIDANTRRRVEQTRSQLAESWSGLPESARPYFARLLRLADAAVQGCEFLPPPCPPLRDGIDLVARVACNGEVMWARPHIRQALNSLADAGFEILGLDLRRYSPDSGATEAPWSSLEPQEGTSNLEQALRSAEAALDSELADYPWVLVTYRRPQKPDPNDMDLTASELELLADGVTDDVSFDMSLIHLGLRDNPPARNEPPSLAQIDAAFRSYERLISAGLLRLGRVQYIDGGPPGRVAPVEHIAEPLAQVRARVEEACRSASDWGDWAFSCWSVNTDEGDDIARHSGVFDDRSDAPE